MNLGSRPAPASPTVLACLALFGAGCGGSGRHSNASAESTTGVLNSSEVYACLKESKAASLVTGAVYEPDPLDPNSTVLAISSTLAQGDYDNANYIGFYLVDCTSTFTATRVMDSNGDEIK